METSLAGTGPGSIAETVPRLLNALVGTKFKIISGYPASSEAMLAMERGEVEGACSSWAAVKVGKQAWLREQQDQDHPADHAGAHRRTAGRAEPGRDRRHARGQAGVPLYASGSAIGRSVIAPPGLPAERVGDRCATRSKMVKDPEFVADLQRTNVELDPLPGARVQELVVRTLNVPATVRDRAKLAFGR